MEQDYWLRRKRSSLARAQAAISAEARLIHFDLAGRYSVQAANCDAAAVGDASGARNMLEINEAQLETLIPRFYERVHADALIGPVFDAAIVDWDAHLEKLVAFWSSVMLTSGRYKGNPMSAHLEHLAKITPPMFDRWLALWSEVTEDVLPPAAAAALQAKAARIAESLQLALYFRIAPTSETDAAPVAPKDSSHGQ